MPSAKVSPVNLSDSKRKKVAKDLHDYYVNVYEDYRHKVLSGERKCSWAEYQKVQRQENDLRFGVEGYVFDLEMGLKPLVWITLNLVFPFGKKRGQPMRLEGWQAYDTIVLFGWVQEKDTTWRRYLDAYIEVARKNGKSAYAAALLDYLIFGEGTGVTGFIAATTLEQAGEVFQRAANSIALVNKNVQVQDSKNNKVIKYNGSVIKAIAGEPKDGKLSYCTIIDEYHEHKDNGIIDSIRFGDVSDQPCMMIRCTTAGVTIGGVCHQEYKKCKAILAGELDVPRYFVSIYEADEKDDPSAITTWEKANPNLGVSVNPDLILANYNSVKGSQSGLTTFKTKNLNMWCHSLQRWANMPIWFEKCHWREDISKLDGHEAYGALDLSAVSDFTAFTLDFFLEDVGKHIQISHFWIPGDMVEELSSQTRMPIRDWIEAGWITATPGPVIDYDYIVDYLNECYERYQIHYIAADRWKIEELVRIAPSWFTDVAYEFSQGMKSMSPTIMDFERTYLEGKVSANCNEVIDWMMSCTETFQDSNGNVKLVKPKRRTEARIDGIITSVMALSNARTHYDEQFIDMSHAIMAW